MARQKPVTKKTTAKPRQKPLKKTTQEKIKIFFQSYADTCDVMEASKKAGISRSSHYRWLSQNEAYRKAWTRTQHLAREYLESELASRATRGWLEPVYYQGQKIGSVRRFDGSTGMALLRGMWPEKYGVNRQELSGPQGTPLQAKIEVVFVKPSQS